MHRAAVLFLTLACREVPEPVTSTASVTCAPNPNVPAVADCAWTTAARAAPSVEYWLADEPATVHATPDGPPGTAHSVAVLGLKAGRSYALQPIVDGVRLGEAVEYVVPSVPAEFPVLTLDTVDVDRAEMDDQYVLTALATLQGDLRFTAVVILDGDGDYVWWTRTGDDGLAASPHLARDGKSVRFLVSDMDWEADIGTIERVSLTGAEVEHTRALLGHHTHWENSDGTLTWLGFDYATVDGVAWASDALRTAPEGSDEADPTVEFAWFAAYPEDPWEVEPGADDVVRYGEGLEWTHSNSLTALDDDFFYVMAKNLDCVLKIDRATGGIVWQLGGLYGDFTHLDGTPVWNGVADNDLFSHSHMSQIWDGGMMVFDNGDLHVPRRTRAVEYAFDEDARTVEQVWAYDDPGGGWTRSMGDVRRLAGGNTLVSWASLEYLSEVTPEGEVVWKVSMHGVGAFGRVTPIASLQ